jgi:hypothetical protein
MPVTEVPETIDAPQETAAPEADRAPQPSTAEPAAVSGGQPAEVQDAEQSVAAAADTQEESVADHDHRADEASWVADLKAVLSEVTDLPTTLYVAPDIPKRKTENAYERYGVPIDEPIVGLLDETAMGSAKNGLAFGARRIYIKNAAGSVSSGAHTVEYEDLASWDIEKQSTYEVALGSDLSYNSLSAKQTTPVLLAVQAMIRRRGGVPPSLNASPGAGQPGGGAPVRVTLDVGERVFAQWSGDSFFYPGIIIGIEDTGVSVRFDDGIQESVANSQVAPVDVGVGSRVSARYGGLDAYYPGEIDGRQGETVHIKYDDGDEELTTISMIRLEQR